MFSQSLVKIDASVQSVKVDVRGEIQCVKDVQSAKEDVTKMYNSSRKVLK